MGGDSSLSSPAPEDDAITIDIHPHSQRPAALFILIPSLSPTNEQNPENASLVQNRKSKNTRRNLGSSETRCPGIIDNIERSPKDDSGRFSNLFVLNERTSTRNPPAHLFFGGDLPVCGNNLDVQPRRQAVHISPSSGSPDSVVNTPLSAIFCLSTSTPAGTYKHSCIMNDVNKNLSLERSDAIGNETAQKRHLLHYREQCIQFHAVMSRIPEGNLGPVLPQLMYKHKRREYLDILEELMLEPPIYFKTEQEGILLKDALHSCTKNLLDRDQAVLEDRGPSVSIRLEWPGYRQWSRQIPTKDFRSPPQPITMAKLAKNIAKCVQRFIQNRKTQPMEAGSDQQWKIGDGSNDIKLENLILVSLHHVSLGSWQPHLRLYVPLSLPAPKTPLVLP